MGQLIVSLVLREVIIAFNVVFKNLITWPSANKMEMVMQTTFKILCGSPSLQGPLMVHIFLSPKLMEFYVKITFITKTIGYSVVCQAIVDDQNQFTNIFVGLPRSVNDSRVLRRSTIYYFAQSQGLFNANKG